MKRQNTSKIILSFYLAFFAFQTFAQEKTVALKFDEFDEKASLIERVNRFAQHIHKDLQSEFYIIYYNPRKSKYGNEGVKSGEYARGILENGYDISQNRITLVDGGIRENVSLELWIVPKGADFPKPNSYFDKSEAITCPEIRVAGSNFQLNKNEPLKFFVETQGGEMINKFDYEWNVSIGRIIEGQGTSRIKVDISETIGKRVTASVRIKGLASECNSHASTKTEVGMFAYKYAEIQYNYSYLAALLDGMFIELINNPNLKGYVIFYGQRVGNSKEVLRSITATYNYMRFRNLDLSRLSIIHGGFREAGAVEIYLVPQGIEFPKPSPTVDEKFVVFTDKIKKKKTRSPSRH